MFFRVDGNDWNRFAGVTLCRKRWAPELWIMSLPICYSTQFYFEESIHYGTSKEVEQIRKIRRLLFASRRANLPMLGWAYIKRTRCFVRVVLIDANNSQSFARKCRFLLHVTVSPFLFWRSSELIAWANTAYETNLYFGKVLSVLVTVTNVGCQEVRMSSSLNCFNGTNEEQFCTSNHEQNHRYSYTTITNYIIVLLYYYSS